jgi:hypothetical protein
MRCSNCDRNNPSGAQVYVTCGTRFAVRYEKCSAENPSDAHFCKRCGSRLDPESVSSSSPSASGRFKIKTEQQRAQRLTASTKWSRLIADIKESTKLQRDLDPEEHAHSSILF